MNKLSALKIYKILLDFTWYGFILFFTFFLINNIYTLLANGELGNVGVMRFPVKVELPQFDFSKIQNAYTFVEKEQANILLELSNVKFNSLTDPFVLLIFFDHWIWIRLLSIKTIKGFVERCYG